MTGLAVESLAARLGATKGSIYWHFARGESLLDAVLARWEVEGTQAIIDAVAQVPSGLPQLQHLFALTSKPARASRVEHACWAQTASWTAPAWRPFGFAMAVLAGAWTPIWLVCWSVRGHGSRVSSTWNDARARRGRQTRPLGARRDRCSVRDRVGRPGVRRLPRDARVAGRRRDRVGAWDGRLARSPPSSARSLMRFHRMW